MWTDSNAQRTRATLATVSITLVGFVLLSFVSFLEHTRSLRPSTLLTVYLGLSALLDVARARTLFFIPLDQEVARVNLACFCVKLLILLLEMIEKRRFLLPHHYTASPEATSGIYNRALFVWLHSLFFKGFRTILTVDILTPLDDDILSASEPSKLVERWNKGSQRVYDIMIYSQY